MSPTLHHPAFLFRMPRPRDLLEIVIVPRNSVSYFVSGAYQTFHFERGTPLTAVMLYTRLPSCALPPCPPRPPSIHRFRSGDNASHLEPRRKIVDAASPAIPGIGKRDRVVLRPVTEAAGRPRAEAAGAAPRQSCRALGEVR